MCPKRCYLLEDVRRCGNFRKFVKGVKGNSCRVLEKYPILDIRVMKKIKNPYQGMEPQGYNCFACCPSNPCGLKMEFYEDGDDVVCFWKPDLNFQSWIGTLHGGIQATLLDEVGGWIVSRKLQTTGMTTHLNVKYSRPAPVGEDVVLEIRGRITEMKRNFAFITATVSHEGLVCSSCDMVYCTFPKDRAEKEFFFHGCELEEDL